MQTFEEIGAVSDKQRSGLEKEVNAPHEGEDARENSAYEVSNTNKVAK